MAFELLIDGWSRGVQQYFYAGQGAVRWVTALDQTAVSLLTFTETHRRLQAMQAVAPLLSGPFFTDTLATLVTPSVYTRTETSEGGSGKAPSLDTAVFPNRTESEPTSTSTPTRQTAVSPPPATNTRLTKQVLRRLADQVWIETLPGQKRLLPVEAMASLPHPLSTSAPPQVTAAPAAAATLINLLSQRAARQTPAVAGVATGRSSRRLPTAAQVTPSLAAAPTVPEMPGHKQATVVMEPLDNAVQRPFSAEGDSPQLENRDQVLSTVLRRGYAQPVGHSVLSQQQLSHLAQSDKRTKAKTAVSSPTITPTTAPGTAVSSPINMAARSLASEAPNMPSSHQSGLESGRVTGRPASPPPLTPESLLAAMPIGDLLQNLVATQPARQKQSWTARPVSAGAAVETAVSGSGPGIHNTFNVTVHSAGGPGDGPDNETEIADRITRILVDQARRHGIDIT